MSFADFGLAEPIMRALAARNYDKPTPIQAQAIPPLREGRDLIGIAQTGTGKTAAFALPTLDRLARDNKACPPISCRVLVLSPTRELAAQIAESFRGYGRFLGFSVATVFGGVPINKQIRQLQRGVDVLVATPGRLLDLIDQRAFHLGGVEIFVLDEADQMMDMGFIAPVKRIAAMVPKERQTLLFSATMPNEIADLARRFLRDPVKVSVTPQATTAERVHQQALFVNKEEKQALLTHLLRTLPIDRALIFTRTKYGADKVVRALAGAKVEAVAIHGDKTQGQRTAALQAFRHGHVRLLVATDIAARGIDVSGVSHVINFELPPVPEQYVHRIGRTARAGADGQAISLVADDERAHLRGIEKLTGSRCEIVPLPAGFAEMVRNLPRPEPRKRPESGGGGQGGRPNGGGKGRNGGARPAGRDGRPDARPDARQDARQGGRQGERPREHANAQPSRDDADGGGKQPSRRPRFGRRKSGVGAHKDAVRKSGR